MRRWLWCFMNSLPKPHLVEYQERVMGFEPMTSCLGSMRSTAELYPQGVVTL